MSFKKVNNVRNKTDTISDEISLSLFKYMNRIYLLLGSNLGEPIKQLSKAKSFITSKIGPIIRSSSLYVTKAWGNTRQPDFINQVIIINTELTPEKLMDTILKIEASLGRIRKQKNDPRTIDIDILFYNKLILQSKNLVIPHPLMQARNFVLYPLNELSPNFVHPIFNKSIHQLLLTCQDTLTVNKI